MRIASGQEINLFTDFIVFVESGRRSLWKARIRKFKISLERIKEKDIKSGGNTDKPDRLFFQNADPW